MLDLLTADREPVVHGGVDFDSIVVPATRLGEMLTHQLDHLAAAGGRLLASHYVPADDRSRHPAEVLSRLGVRVDGVTGPGDNAGRAVPPTAWVQRR